ncbi:AMP-binding protein [Hydrogenophaga sp.]|uniref:class I adenylate-forming enzyme family protein n=1 Tax=Hydrogenophaga sp. TaxID=1904254 RepID=UPI0025BB2DEE|nr:AMP-binding protein [Hydrogenophaga sp.]
MTTPAAPPAAASFDAVLSRLAATYPDKPLLCWLAAPTSAADWAALTGIRLQQRVSQAQHWLTHSAGVVPGERVAWLGLNHPAQVVLLLALARLDAMLVPLNHRLSPAEWANVLRDCRPQTLLHDEHFGEQGQALARTLMQDAGLKLQAWSVNALLDNPAPAWPAKPAAEVSRPDSPLLLVYTSGTTGEPKGAVHTQAHLLANMAIAADVQRLRPDDRVLTVLPLFHVGGLCIQTLPALGVGATVHLCSRFEAAATLASIAHERITLTLQVPATLQALTQHADWPHADLSSLRAIWAGSSLLPAPTLEAVHERGVPVCNVYGSTETGPFSIALAPEHAHSHLGSCGWPAPGVSVKLCDARGESVAAGQVGEICLRAPNVVQRYWPDRAAVDADGYFHSGDLASQAVDGSFTIVGRSKDMIISGGENIYPAEIENLLLQHPWVRECAVVAQDDARWGEVAVAVVVLDAVAGDTWEQALQSHLQDRLARYKWPRRWQRLHSLPRTALGKVQKAALRTQLAAGLVPNPPDDLPRA